MTWRSYATKELSLYDLIESQHEKVTYIKETHQQFINGGLVNL